MFFTSLAFDAQNVGSSPGLSIYGNLLIESVSSVFHFRRVPFFNGIKKNFISVLKAIFVGCRFLTISKKNFISVLKVRGAFLDHQMTFPCHLLHSCSIDGDL
jgi:hypothetical protein